MKNLKLLFFVIIIFFCSNVFAAEFNMNSYTSATKNGTKNRYRATEIYNTGMSNTYTFGTKYSGRISDIETYFDYPFSANMTYRLTYNMNTDDFRNHFGSSYWWYCDQEMSNINAHVSTVNYVSYRKVTFTFTPTETSTCIRVWLRSNNLSSTAITGVSNWQLNNITIYDPEWQNGTSSSSGSQGTSPGSSGTSSTNNNEEIINNATENTHTIVDNQNQNTQDIINNNNDNTQQIIDNQQELLGNCVTNVMTSSDILSLDNLYQSGNNFQQINADTNSVLSLSLQAYNNGDYLYNLGDTQIITTTNTYSIRFTKTSDFDTIMFKLDGIVRDTGLLINVSSLNDDHIYYIGADFFRITQGDIRFNRLIIKENPSLGFAPWGETICLSKLDDTNSAINNSTNTIINNQNQNTNTIINNQNENTNKQIESQKVCQLIDKSSSIVYDKRLNATGGLQDFPNFSVTDYIYIPTSTITVLSTRNASAAHYCFYDSFKNRISCNTLSSLTLNSTITKPANAFYFRTSIQYVDNQPTFNICSDGNQAITDTLTNSNVDNGVGSGFFNDFTSQDFGLSQIITIPLNTIQGLTSKSCSALSVPIPFTNSNVSLPCMTQIYESKFPSIYNLWKIVSFGIVAYLIAIDIFHIVKGFKDPESDKVEVLDL